MAVLTALGAKGRAVFTESIIELLDEKSVPAAIKVAWNDNVRAVLPD
jgi:hypothetical protein